MSVSCECCVMSGGGLRRADPLSRGFLWMSVSCECCVMSGGGLRRADPLSRGVLWMFVLSVCVCVLSGRGLCDRLIPCPEDSYGCLSLVSVV